MVAFTLAIMPKTGMINFCEALVVASLYTSFYPPDEEDTIERATSNIQLLINRLDTQRLIFANQILECRLVFYSKVTRRPIENNVALDLLAQEQTSDILILEGDLLYGGRYPGNSLSGAIKNAQEILRNNPSILQACTAAVENTIPSDAISPTASEQDTKQPSKEHTRQPAEKNKEKAQVKREHELRDLIGRTFEQLRRPGGNNVVWQAITEPENDIDGLIQEKTNDKIYWKSWRDENSERVQTMSRKTFNNYLRDLRNP